MIGKRSLSAPDRTDALGGGAPEVPVRSRRLSFLRMGISRAWRRLRNEGLWSVGKRALTLLQEAIFPTTYLIYWLPISEVPDPGDHDHLELRVVSDISSVDPQDLKAIEENVGHASLPVIQHRIAHVAELHVLLYDGNVIGTRFFIMGVRHAFQHVILTEFDSMDIDGRINPEFRGRGLNPLFFRMNIAHLRRQGILRLYVACSDNNEASIRSFVRVGFRFLARYKVRCGYHIYDPLAL